MNLICDAAGRFGSISILQLEHQINRFMNRNVTEASVYTRIFEPFIRAPSVGLSKSVSLIRSCVYVLAKWVFEILEPHLLRHSFMHKHTTGPYKRARVKCESHISDNIAHTNLTAENAEIW